MMLALVALLLGLLILKYGAGSPLIRYTLGDFIIVIFLYSALRTFLPHISGIGLGVGVFLFALSVELLQLTGFPQHFDTRKLWVQVLLGSRFEWLDIVMYALGTLTVMGIEHFFWKEGH
jgi:hypothetical protein